MKTHCPTKCGAALVVLVQLLLSSSTAVAQTPTDNGARVSPASMQTVGQIRGVAFDSLKMKPFVGTKVLLMSDGRTAMTDDHGRFHFDNVEAGKQEIAFNTAEYDSLGLGTLGGSVVVEPQKTSTVTVGPPSLPMLWKFRCNADNTIGRDSGIVWGNVREAATGAPAVGGAATFAWYDLRPGTTKGVIIDNSRKGVATDESGTYFACGVPTDITLSAEAVTSSAGSGEIEFAVGAQRLHRIDFLISPEMALPDSAHLLTHEDSASILRPRGSAVLRGLVVNDKKQPMSNAVVGIATVDTTVRTDDAGRFQLGTLPAGTHALFARRIGQPAASQLVNLRAGATTDVVVELSSTNTLATVNVRADKVRSAEHIAYDQRRARGMSHAIDGEQLQRMPDTYLALENVPRVKLERSGFGVKVTFKRLGLGYCTPAAFLDGFQTDMETASSLPTILYRAIEVYTTPAAVPAEFESYASLGCGVVLFWTKRRPW